MNDNSIYAVCGRPILHSKSPNIFRMLFDSMKIPACYTRIASDNPKEILSIADELGFAGLNVTAPFKAEMFKLMDDCDNDSQTIGAVNTVKILNGKKYGYNTDVSGVTKTLKKNGIELENRDCLIIGYGNAAGAAAYGIKKEWKNINIYVTGRSKEKAEDFAKKYDCTPFIGWEIIQPFLIISTLPRNAYHDINEYMKSCEYFLDAAYPDSFMANEAKKFKCKIILGEEWLINQALASFKIFTGKDIPHTAQNDKDKWNLNQVQNDIINNKKNILLTGFSGSGKTSIGKLLSEKLGYLYFDTDKLIEELENLSINEIFKQKGEEYFRSVEKVILDKVCNINKAVISCGGGTLCNSENLHIAQKSGYIVWLHTSLEKCLNRIDTKYKPMLYEKSIKEIEKLYNERKIIYCKSSDLLVANTGEPSAAVENIIYEMKMIENNSEL